MGYHNNKPYTLGETRLYVAWSAMKCRCNDKNNPIYGGKGISFCSEWSAYKPFFEWAMANGYARNLVIDRIDNQGNYEPSNCRWITKEENARLATVYRKSIDGYRLTKESASAIKRAIASGASYSDLADEFSVCVTSISNIACGLTWADAEPLGRVSAKSVRLSSISPDVKKRISDLAGLGYSPRVISETLGVTMHAARTIRIPLEAS